MVDRLTAATLALLLFMYELLRAKHLGINTVLCRNLHYIRFSMLTGFLFVIFSISYNLTTFSTVRILEIPLVLFVKLLQPKAGK